LEHMGGKKYLGFDEAQSYAIPPAKQEQWLEQLAALKEKQTTIEQALHSYINSHAVSLKALCEGHTYAKKGLPELLASPVAFVEELISRRKSAYISKLFPEIMEQADALTLVTDELALLEQD